MDWFSTANKDAIHFWMVGRVILAWCYHARLGAPHEENFVYDERERPMNLRDAYLWSAVQLSEIPDPETEAYLLIPEVIFPNEEWEA